MKSGKVGFPKQCHRKIQMENNEKELSCYSTHLLLQYARKNNLKHATDNVSVPVEILDNPKEWTYSTVFTQISENIEKELCYPNDIIITIIEEIFFHDNNIFFPLIIKVIPTQLLLHSITKYGNRYSNKNMVSKITPIGKNCWKFIVQRAKPGHFSRQMCDFNQGAARALLHHKGFTNIKITEQCCVPRKKAESCTYIIEAAPPKSLIHRLANYILFLFRNQNAIIHHLEANQEELQKQYSEILSIRDFYSHIMESMNESIVWLNADGIITFANHAFELLTHDTSTLSTGCRFEKYLRDDFLSAQFKLLCSDARKKPFLPMVTEFTYASRSVPARIGETTIRWIPGEHYPPGFIISIRDISDRRGIERQLFAAEDRYRSLYENSPALIVAVSMEGTFLYANPAMTEQSGYSEKELCSMHFKELVAPKAEFDVDRLLTSLLSSPSHLQEVHFKTKQGDWKCVALNTYHLTGSDGAVTGIAGIGIDITETKRLNEQIVRTQRMDLLGQLAGGLAHDFGNVLTSINGFSKLIAGKTTDEKIRHYAESIERAGHRAHDLVKSLLAFSRNDTTKVIPFDVVSIVDEVYDMLCGATGANITVKAELPKESLLILGDPGKIHQCILNLGINARDAIGEKPGTITLKVNKKVRNGNNQRVLIEVVDTGCGIAPDILDKIYDPFFSTKEKKAGTGLGLSVVYGIIKSHNGEISVDTHPGEGTTFSVEFPGTVPSRSS